MKAHAILITTLVAVPLHADPRTSANYRLEPETVDGGGGRSSSTNYALDSSLAPSGGARERIVRVAGDGENRLRRPATRR